MWSFNPPSLAEMNDLDAVVKLDLVRGCGFIFTAGNHDWHLEGQRGAASYDAARVPELFSTFRRGFPLVLFTA